MNERDILQERLAGSPSEKKRRRELLEVLLDKFNAGGAESVTAELESRLKVLKDSFDAKLAALEGLQS
jgi:hypothetical protein